MSMNNSVEIHDPMIGIVYHHQAQKVIENITKSAISLFTLQYDRKVIIENSASGQKIYNGNYPIIDSEKLSGSTKVSDYLISTGMTVTTQIGKKYDETIKATSQSGDFIIINLKSGEMTAVYELVSRPTQSRIERFGSIIRKYPASAGLIVLWFIVQSMFAIKFKSDLTYDDDSQSLFGTITGVIPLISIVIEDAVFSHRHKSYRQYGNKHAFATYLPRLLMAGTLMALSMGIPLGITHSIGDGVAYGLMMGFFVPFMICAAVFFIIVYSVPIGFVFKTWRDKGENSFFFTGSGLLGILLWGPVTAVILNTKMVGSGQSRGIATLIMIPLVAIGVIPFPAEWVLVTRVSLVALLIVIIMAIVKKKTPIDKKTNINRLFIVTTFTGLAITIATTLWASYPIIVRAIIGLGNLLQILLNLK